MFIKFSILTTLYFIFLFRSFEQALWRIPRKSLPKLSDLTSCVYLHIDLRKLREKTKPILHLSLRKSVFWFVGRWRGIAKIDCNARCVGVDRRGRGKLLEQCVSLFCFFPLPVHSARPACYVRAWTVPTSLRSHYETVSGQPAHRNVQTNAEEQCGW